MPVRKQLTLFLPSTVGQLSAVASALPRHGVNIEAISVWDAADSAMVRLLVSDTGKAKSALKKFCSSIIESPVVVASLPNRPGILTKAAAKIARARINIEYVYGSTGGWGTRP